MATEQMPALPQEYKACKDCGAEKPVKEFIINRRLPTGITSLCRDCYRVRHKQWRMANVERWRQTTRKWREDHPAEMAVIAERQLAKSRAKTRRLREKHGLPPLEVRNLPEGRMCSRCRTRKPWAEFRAQSSYTDGYSPYCSACAAERFRQRMLREYGIDEAKIAAVLAQQNNCCAICQQSFIGMRRRQGPLIDHDHRTGKFRGLLCTKCNAGIGQLNESVGILASAIRYLNAGAAC